MTEKEIYALQQQVALFHDQQAFQQLFKHYYRGVFQFAVSIIKVRESAEEIVEDVFIMLWKKRDTLTAINNFKVYLYVSVKNRCLNFIGRQHNDTFMDLDQLDVVCAELVPNPEDMMVASELLQLVNKAIHELPPKCRIVYKLVKEDGLQYKEVAEILNISPRTVENHIALAVKKIAAVVDVDLSSYHKSAYASSKY
ncbi:MAG: RNA polymerase sigma-70 factor [Agriterribacter sp.]